MSAEKARKNEETVHFPGVSEALPKFYSGKEAVYYCGYCQTAPKASDNQEVVWVSHDICVSNLRPKVEKVIEEFKEETDMMVARHVGKRANIVLGLDPRASDEEAFGKLK